MKIHIFGILISHWFKEKRRLYFNTDKDPRDRRSNTCTYGLPLFSIKKMKMINNLYALFAYNRDIKNILRGKFVNYVK